MTTTRLPAAKTVERTRPFGVHPLAWTAYLKTGLPASRIGQTIGTAAASANTHLRDGLYQGVPYAACTDLRIRDLSDAEVKAILPILGRAGFAAFFRSPDYPADHWNGVRHIHMIWSDCTMKASVQHQVKDYCAQPMLNGLSSHLSYTFWQPGHAERLAVKSRFNKHYPGTFDL